VTNPGAPAAEGDAGDLIADGYFDIGGTWHPVPDHVRAALVEVVAPVSDARPMWFVHPGEEHRLLGPCELVLEDGASLGTIEALPPDLPLGYHDLAPRDGGPVTRLVVAPSTCPTAPTGWGVAAQLYAVSSATSQGIGDLVDLARLTAWVERLGGTAVLLNPLHAPGPTTASRGQEDSPYFPSSRLWRNPLHLHVDGLEPWRTTLIDRDEVWRRKREALWAGFVRGEDDPEWRRWAEPHGDALADYARWTATAEGTATTGGVEFHMWLQHRFDQQLAAAHGAAPRVALIGDLAIGFDPLGADAADFADVLAAGWRIGAPPDAFNEGGQDWGLPPFSPPRLRAALYEPFIATIRGTLRGLQGLRIDHVMGLFRQYWIPPGAPATDGAYVRFPARELLSIVALEATRAGAFVVGEDLGTVEPHVREEMAARHLLRTTVTWFTDDAPPEYPVDTLASLSTHDLPTVAGIWRGMDGDVHQRDLLTRITGMSSGTPAAEMVVAAHEALAAAPSRLKLATLDDLCVADRRPNVPGTIASQRPNWRLPLPLTFEQLERSPIAQRVARALDRGAAE
jgi:4-alpha-glucanotransferase